MNTIRRPTFAFLAALALLFTGAAQAQTRPAALVEGRDYVAIAEGIEEPGQYELLRDTGCDLGQGYLFGKPMSHEDMMKLLA